MRRHRGCAYPSRSLGISAENRPLSSETASVVNRVVNYLVGDLRFCAKDGLLEPRDGHPGREHGCPSFGEWRDAKTIVVRAVSCPRAKQQPRNVLEIGRGSGGAFWFCYPAAADAIVVVFGRAVSPIELCGSRGLVVLEPLWQGGSRWWRDRCTHHRGAHKRPACHEKPPSPPIDNRMPQHLSPKPQLERSTKREGASNKSPHP
jgi:hypothetical protein